MAKVEMCDACKQFMLDLLDKRIRMVLDVGRENLNEDRRLAEERDEPFDDDQDFGQAECFHFMELQRILRGQTTCGVFDDYGKPPTIEGPLFPNQQQTDGG